MFFWQLLIVIDMLINCKIELRKNFRDIKVFVLLLAWTKFNDRIIYDTHVAWDVGTSNNFRTGICLQIEHGKNFFLAGETFIKSHKKQMLLQAMDSKVRLESFLPCLLLLCVSGHPSNQDLENLSWKMHEFYLPYQWPEINSKKILYNPFTPFESLFYLIWYDMFLEISENSQTSIDFSSRVVQSTRVSISLEWFW